MSRIFTFHKTVRGYLHIMRGSPCEDFSASRSAADGRYHIAVVADGHGSGSCFRSDYGSKAAAAVAMECLQEFAETALASKESEDRFYKDMFSNPRYRKMAIKQLTDSILAGWHDRVLDHYKSTPPSVEELSESAAEHEGGGNPAHIYGTTLIAALQMPGCLVLVHQGDGRCDVFYTDGSVDQPIPWDPRCDRNITTSLCDADAAGSFRSCVLDLSEKPVMACYLGCDGVEDAYRDTYAGSGGSHSLMGGVHTFYKDMTCRLLSLGEDEFEKTLEAELSDFSARGKFSGSGSGDDVSVAGIVDLDAVPQFISRFEYDVKRYALDEDLFWKEDALRGKTRKHGILKKRLNDAQSALDEARKKQQLLETERQQLKRQREDYAREVEKARGDLDESRRQSQQLSEQLNNNFPSFFAEIQYLFEEISTSCSRKEAAYRTMSENLLEYDRQIGRAEEVISSGSEQVRELERAAADAQAAFDEYDAEYQEIDSARIRIEEEIAALEAGKPESYGLQPQ